MVHNITMDEELTTITRPFDSHKKASEKHKDGRKDHHHGVDGNGMLC